MTKVLAVMADLTSNDQLARLPFVDSIFVELARGEEVVVFIIQVPQITQLVKWRLISFILLKLHDTVRMLQYQMHAGNYSVE